MIVLKNIWLIAMMIVSIRIISVIMITQKSNRKLLFYQSRACHDAAHNVQSLNCARRKM